METKKRRTKRTPESYKREVSEITGGEYSVLGDFVNTRTKINHCHENCGHKWEVTPNNFIGRGTRCPRCSKSIGASKRAISKEDFQIELDELTGGDYTITGKYLNSRSPVEVRHNVCGRYWNVRRDSIVNKGARCPKCSIERRSKEMTKSTSQFTEQVNTLGGGYYSFFGSYNGGHDVLEFKHHTCQTTFKATPREFIRGKRCPICTSEKLSLERRKTDKEFKEQVKELVGGEYIFTEPYQTNKTKIEVSHTLCGHTYSVKPNKFLSGSRCPRCAGRPLKVAPPRKRSLEEFRMEVSEFSEGAYFVDSVIRANHRKGIKKTSLITFHEGCGKYFSSTYSDLKRGRGCPHCFGTPKRTHEEFVKLVSQIVGDEYKVIGKYTSALSAVEMEHSLCGSSWKVIPTEFTSSGTRCPNCVYSRGEKAAADVLDSLSIEYTREHSFEYLGRKRFDFFIPSLNIAIEYDGEQHFKAIDHWGGEETLKRTQESDALKNDFCDYMGIDLLRIPYWEFDNIDEIVTNFIDTVKLMRSISASG